MEKRMMIDGQAQQRGLDRELRGAEGADLISTTLSQAFAILDACAGDGTAQTVQNLALRVNQPIAVVALLLSELERSGFVTRTMGCFRLGHALAGAGCTGDHSNPRPASAGVRVAG
jgi:hypothetical protein